MNGRQTILKSIIGILSVVTMGISLMMIGALIENMGSETDLARSVQDISYSSVRPVAATLFLFLVLLHLIQGIASFRESKLFFLKHLIYIVFCAYATVLLVRRGEGMEVWPTVCFLYMMAVLIGRMISFIRRRSKWNALMILLMLAVAFLGGSTVLVIRMGQPDDQGLGAMLAVMLLFFLVDAQGIASVVPLAFYSIRLDILKKIIRKTYAIEILFGIVLLIVAFSFMLPAFEPGINNFGDALWYCFAIVTTIGFGDITATSVIGRVMSVILGIYGIIVVSLITSIIVNFYGEIKKEEDDKEKEEAGGKNADGRKTKREKAGSRKTKREKADNRKTGSRRDDRRREDRRREGSRKTGPGAAGEENPMKNTFIFEEIDL